MFVLLGEKVMSHLRTFRVHNRALGLVAGEHTCLPAGSRGRIAFRGVGVLFTGPR